VLVDFPTTPDLLAMSRGASVGDRARVFSLVLDETGGTLKKTAAAFVALGLQAV
jgi:hypothetical protein